jgi:hypothetical protein
MPIFCTSLQHSNMKHLICGERKDTDGTIKVALKKSAPRGRKFAYNYLAVVFVLQIFIRFVCTLLLTVGIRVYGESDCSS